MNCSEVSFSPLKESDFSLIHQWFNKPHVQAFYSLRDWSLEEVKEKLAPEALKKKRIQGFIIYLDEKPIGYIQSYPVKDHPWKNQDLSEEIVSQAAGIDLFIGEEEMLQKGLGPKIIDSFLEGYIWPSYRYCLADPNVRNALSIRLFEKIGFKKHKTIDVLDALDRPISLQLFIKECPLQRDFAIQQVLDKPLIAHLATVCEEGPRSSPLWFLYEDQRIWLFGTKKDSFIKRLQNEPHAALSVVDFDLEKGILLHVGIRGKALLHEVDPKRLRHFVGKYLGHETKAWNKWFIKNIVDPLNVMVEVKPNTIVAKDVSFFKTGHDLAKE